MWSLLLVWVMINISTAYENNETEVYTKPFVNTAGVLFITKGEVTFTSTAWQLAFSVNLSTIDADLQRVKMIFRAARSNKSHEVDFKMMKRLEQTIVTVEGEYQYLIQEIQQKMTGKTRRPQRSLNPFDWIEGSLGSIARRLFGVASAEEVSRINSYVDVLYRRDQKIASLQTLHITALKGIEGQIEKQKHQLTSLVNFTGTLFEALLPGVKDRKVLSETILLLHAELATTLSTFRNTIQKLLRLVELLTRGYVSPELLPIEELAQTLDHIETQIPPGMRLVYGDGNETKDDLYPYYHNPLATIIPGKQDIRGILQIPIADEKNRFEIYRVVPFPTRSNGIQGKQRFQWAGSETFVAMTSNHQRYTELGPWFSKKRCLPGPPVICSAHMVISTNPEEKCLFQLLTGKLNNKKIQCPFEQVNEGVTIVQSINEVEWAVTTNEELTVKSSCLDIEDPSAPMRKLPRFTITGEAVVIIPKHCTSTIGNYLVPLRISITTGNEDIQSQIRGFQLPIQELLKQQGETLHEDKVQQTVIDAYQQLLLLGKNMSSHDPTSEEVYQVIATMSNVDAEIQKMQPIWVTHYMSFAGWLTLSMIIIVAMIVLVKFRKRIMSWTTDWSSIVPTEEAQEIHPDNSPPKPARVVWVAAAPRRNRFEEDKIEINSV